MIRWITIRPNISRHTETLNYYIEKSIIFGKIFRTRVCSTCHQSAAFGVEYNIE